MGEFSRRFWPIIFPGILVVIFSAVILWQLTKPNRQDGDDEFLSLARAATEYGSGVCKPNLTIREKRNIDANVAAGLRRIDSKGESATETIERSIDESFSEEGKLRQDERIRACMVEQAAWFIGKHGSVAQTTVSHVGRIAAADMGRGERPSAFHASEPTAPSRTGFIYFEEKDGQATDAGRFTATDSPSTAHYRDLRTGQVLEAVGTARLREGPGTNFRIIKEVHGQSCVKVLEAPSLPIMVQSATSGGHVKVQETVCPVI